MRFSFAHHLKKEMVTAAVAAVTSNSNTWLLPIAANRQG